MAPTTVYVLLSCLAYVYTPIVWTRSNVPRKRLGKRCGAQVRGSVLPAGRAQLIQRYKTELALSHSLTDEL